MSEIENDNIDQSDDSGRAGALSLLFRPDPAIWNECRRLLADRNLRVEDLATCAAQDPVIVLDLLKIANALFFSGGRSPITTIKTAVVRLGSDVVIDTLESLKDRPAFPDQSIAKWFEIHRSRCRRASLVSRILGEALARTMSDECQSIGLLLYIGEMLATAHFGEQYVKLAEQQSRSGVLYKLHQQHKFDCEVMGLTYLRRSGIPEAMISILDREATLRASERAILKPIVQAAGEMVEAFDASKWEKLAPGKPLSPKSALRILQMSDSQYLKIYERVSGYLYSSRDQDVERRKEKEPQFISAEELAVEDVSETSKVQGPGHDDLAGEIDALISMGSSAKEESESDEFPDLMEPELRSETRLARRQTVSSDGDFALTSPKKVKARKTTNSNKAVRDVAQSSVLKTDKAVSVLKSLGSLFDAAKDSESTIASLLELLVAEGLFEKAALIVISRDKSKAKVVSARGAGIEKNFILELKDPLSPLAQQFSKVQSFGFRESENSPFGAKAYALAPIDADHDSPVALYADCGNSGGISFEARRVFRIVVDALNKKLPELPGGIPVEI